MTIAETADTVSSFFRMVFGSLIVCILGYAGGWICTHFTPDLRLQQKEHELQQVSANLNTAQQQLANQHTMLMKMDHDLQASQQRIVQLDTSLRLMKVNQRIAQVNVTRQTPDATTGDVFTEFTFQEVNKQGTPVDHPRTFRIQGDLLYIDYWVVKFADEFVEQANLDRSTSICLFRRLFGEHQEPYQGYTLDQVESRPNVYGRDGMVSDFEQQIWSEFWEFANNPDRAAEKGIRAAHGEAVATRLRPGQTYRVLLRASDGLTIQPVAVADRQAGI